MFDPLMWLAVLIVYVLFSRARVPVRLGACGMAAAALSLVVFEMRTHGAGYVQRPIPFYVVPLAAAVAAGQGVIFGALVHAISRFFDRHPID